MLLTFRKRNEIFVFQRIKIRLLRSKPYVFLCPGSPYFLVEVLNVLEI